MILCEPLVSALSAFPARAFVVKDQIVWRERVAALTGGMRMVCHQSKPWHMQATFPHCGMPSALGTPVQAGRSFMWQDGRTSINTSLNPYAFMWASMAAATASAGVVLSNTGRLLKASGCGYSPVPVMVILI
jgi:hypothetical protein